MPRMHARRVRLAAALFASLTALPAQQDPDSDGDGLSDFHELHKYLTDPQRKDSDGDGTPDGDWRERREYQYTVRSVVQVMRPVTIDWLCDDYQDARVLDETADHVELEVIHYPFHTVAGTLAADADWRRHTARMQEWLAPGPTSDWTPKLQQDLRAALRKDGIDAGKLDDRALVEQAAKWLLQRAQHHDGFTTFVTAFDKDGKPFVPAELQAGAEANAQRSGVPLTQQWQRELSARGMFEHKARGSCSSSAIYLSGCLRALGIPTRTILVIPIVDADDDRERAMLQRLQLGPVRRTLAQAAEQRRNSWASHTFNEVFVGGRWRRLNYDRLGQPTYDRQLFGLCTHVATFRDWADADMPATIGRRQKLNRHDDVFGGPNPYSTIALRDEIGVHCDRGRLPPDELQAKVTALSWGDDRGLPADVQEWFREHRRTGLIAKVEGLQGPDELRDFLAATDLAAALVAAGDAKVEVAFEPGCWWWKQDHGLLLVRFGGQPTELAKGRAYTLAPNNAAKTARWEVGPDLRVTRE